MDIRKTSWKTLRMEISMQENRTIIFQVVDQQAPDILTLIGDIGEQLSLEDEVIWNIREQLEVHSAKEYLERFHPVLYEYLDTEQLQAEYSMERIPALAMWETRHVFQSDYWLIRFTDAVLQARKRQHNLRNPFYELWDYRFGTENKFDMLKMEWKKLWLQGIENVTYQEKVRKLISVLKKNYDEGSFLLYYYIKDREENMNCSLEAKRQNICLEKLEDCEVERIGYAEKEETECVLDYEQAKQWQAYLEDSLRTAGIRNHTLMARCLVGLVDYGIKGREAEVRIYNIYTEFWKNAVESYLKIALPILNQYMNVFSYFQQNQRKEKNMALLVANCGIEKLLQPKYAPGFRAYLESVNEKAYCEDTIWHAILPGVSVLKEDRRSLRRERFAGTKADGNEDELDAAAKMEEILSAYQIQCFISSIDGELASFSALMEKGVYVFEEAFGKIPEREDEKWLSPCYPNFTVIPKSQARFQLAKKADVKDDGTAVFSDRDSVKASFPGIYVEASYVAAGVFAAYNWNVWEKENEQESRIYPMTTMPKEVFTYPKAFELQLAKNSSGVTFAFSREIGKENYAVVLTERTMAYRRERQDTVASVKMSIRKNRNDTIRRGRRHE